MKIDSITCDVILRVKLSLWSAIKLRIAGMKNIFDLEKKVIDIVNEGNKDGRIVEKNK